MVFIPDPDTAAVDPFAEIPTLTMSGDVCVIGKDSNTPFDQYPKNVCKKSVEYMKEQGVADEMLIGPEFEFYLLDHVSYQVTPQKSAYHLDTRQAEWDSGRDDIANNGYEVGYKGGYHAAAPQDIGFDLRNQMCLALEDWGVKVKYHHHEVGGPGQMEIEVELGDLVSMADNTCLLYTSRCV